MGVVEIVVLLLIIALIAASVTWVVGRVTTSRRDRRKAVAGYTMIALAPRAVPEALGSASPLQLQRGRVPRTPRWLATYL